MSIFGCSSRNVDDVNSSFFDRNIHRTIPTAIAIICVLGGLFLLLASFEVLPPFPNAISVLEGGAAIGVTLMIAPFLCCVVCCLPVRGLGTGLYGYSRPRWPIPFYYRNAYSYQDTIPSVYGRSFTRTSYGTPSAPSVTTSFSTRQQPYSTPSAPSVTTSFSTRQQPYSTPSAPSVTTSFSTRQQPYSTPSAPTNFNRFTRSN